MSQTQYASEAWDYENLKEQDFYITHGLSPFRLKHFSKKALEFSKECHIKYFKEDINDCRQYVHKEIVEYVHYSENILSTSILSSPKLIENLGILSMYLDGFDDLLKIYLKQQNTFHKTGFVLKIQKECYIALYPTDILSPTEAFSPPLGKEKLYGTLDEELEKYFNPLSQSKHSKNLQEAQKLYNIYDHLISSPLEILYNTDPYNELLVKTNLDCFDIVGVYSNLGADSLSGGNFIAVMNKLTDFKFTQFYGSAIIDELEIDTKLMMDELIHDIMDDFKFLIDSFEV